MINSKELILNNNKLKIIDDFLSKEDLDALKKNNFKKQDNNKEFEIFHNEVNDNGVIKSTLDNLLIKKLHKNYHSIAMNILKDINYEKSKLYDYSDFTIIITNKFSKFPIHDDTPNKLLSGVIYLSPEKNNGTSFYSNKNLVSQN